MDLRTEWLPGEMEVAQRIGRVFAKKPWPGFEAAVREYRQIEAEIVAAQRYDQFMLLELKRRITEWIVKCAWRDDVPFEQFREAWNGLLELGFSDIHSKEMMAWFYADYCLSNEHFDAGIEVLEPVIAEYEAWLQGAVLKPKERKFYEGQIKNLKFLHEGLIALRTGGAAAEDWIARDEARGPTPQDERRHELRGNLYRAMKEVSEEASTASFTEIERAYRQVDADFSAQLQPDDDFFVPELKHRIACAIFVAAHEHRQPFEVCRDLWNALQPWDFGHLEHKCPMIRRYAECCIFNQQPDAGLAVVEPLLAALQHQVDTGTDEDMPSGKYPEEIARLKKLRDELDALRGS